MAKTGNQKAKILYLERMLWKTGEEKLLTMQEILDGLEAFGIHGERKSVYDDMEVLRSFGMDIRYKRGVGGGYYLAAQETPVPESLMEKEPPEKTASEKTAVEIPEAEEISRLEEPVVRPDINEAYGRKVRLLVEKDAIPEIAAAAGDEVSYKEKDETTAVVVLHVSEDEKFFGWLASFGKKVHIMKPAKTALAYRNFLKGIAREYKGIDK